MVKAVSIPQQQPMSPTHPDVSGFQLDLQPPSGVEVAPTVAMRPPAKPRKPKAPTLSAAAWAPHKDRILELHITKAKPLAEVRQIMEIEYGFKAE
jgi:hypothetical protein